MLGFWEHCLETVGVIKMSLIERSVFVELSPAGLN